MNIPPAAQAVEQLAHDYGKLVFHTIYGMTNDWEESQDLTQETFVQALRAIDVARVNMGGKPFHAKAWLLQIAVNTVRMQRRRHALFRFIPFSRLHEERHEPGQEDQGVDSILAEQRLPTQPAGYAGSEHEDFAERIAEQDAVRRAMATLPEPLRVCLLLSIVGGLSSPEIARTLDITEATVRQRLSRARKQFQQAYTRESGEELVDTLSPGSPTFMKSDPFEQHMQSNNVHGPHHLTLFPRS